MPFHFSLHAVLHLYQSLEHQQELRLRAANQQVAKVRHMIDQIDAHRLQQQARQSQELQAGTTSAELEFGRSGELMLKHRRDELELELTRAQQLRDEQQRNFRLVRRRRETLDSLRENQLREYERGLARREQQRQDEAFLFQRRNSR